MSEAARKDFHTKAEEKLVRPPSTPSLTCNTPLTPSPPQTPDASKSTLDKTKESLTGAADKTAREAEPGTSPSTPPPLSFQLLSY